MVGDLHEIRRKSPCGKIPRVSIRLAAPRQHNPCSSTRLIHDDNRFPHILLRKPATSRAVVSLLLPDRNRNKLNLPCGIIQTQPSLGIKNATRANDRKIKITFLFITILLSKMIFKIQQSFKSPGILWEV
jgi:hypothetical protein